MEVLAEALVKRFVVVLGEVHCGILGDMFDAELG